jgi:hypothetical protein
MEDPRRHPNVEVISEWTRRKERYRHATRYLRLVCYLGLAAAFLLFLLGSGEWRSWGVGLFFGVALAFVLVLQFLAFRFLRCPSCDRLPDLRGNAFSAYTCGRCLNYLTHDAVPNR